MSSNWFSCVLVIPFHDAKVFSESVTNASSSFANVYLFAISAGYAVDDISGGAREVISNLTGSFGSGYFVNIVNVMKSFVSCVSAFESSGSVISLTKKVLLFLSRSNERNGGCEKLVPLSRSF